MFFVLFQRPPPAEAVKELVAQDFGEEKVVITKHGGYLYVPGNAARSKLCNNFLEKKLGVGSTSRNFNTMSKLIELASVPLD